MKQFCDCLCNVGPGITDIKKSISISYFVFFLYFQQHEIKLKDGAFTPDALRIDRSDYVWFKWNNVSQVNSIQEVWTLVPICSSWKRMLLFRLHRNTFKCQKVTISLPDLYHFPIWSTCDFAFGHFDTEVFSCGVWSLEFGVWSFPYLAREGLKE